MAMGAYWGGGGDLERDNLKKTYNIGLSLKPVVNVKVF